MIPYKSSTWALELPDGWTGRDEGDCHTFLPSGSHGAFQISAYLKEEDPVSDDDLLEFAEGVPTRKVIVGDFTGICTRFSADDIYWIKWWFRSGHTMIHATYNCADDERNPDIEEAVFEIVDSLKSKK